ncbi:uncharacterized protein CcaverHIS019_0102680 [Cutaneotrichosporon cavernicola]|uniref:sphinganine-1-phosphate aldolase n=1 Tax=Cutaneotrichosporon cavernicola TaxID=279322 RepID=A0AA48I469_9TREE|nr:uncharacterized protein CcaverHIS019_0102680 [Cutaneotrichosporon cavernicola]BEI87550.1 hypothetical protein CcaverHIS019_0102680 [Cutaneotrichosporon cavernicola]BEI95322.1 hypothetical protein CcaverHIS631_0102710 [Cutaneotrichosporon cavernicola]BEJ03095.1 hypothetical protein CcaverHIS641_0102700 [Cutaneotrichosporon cavernicola]
MPQWSQLAARAKPGPRTQLVLQRAAQLGSLFRLVIFLKALLGLYRHVYAYGITGTSRQIYGALKNVFVRIMLRMPSARAQIAKELAKTRAELSSKIAPKTLPPGVELEDVNELPESGRNIEWLRNEWTNMAKLDRGDLEAGRVSGAVYHGGDDLNVVINEAMSNFIVSNPLHPDVFPGVRRMEAELVSMVLKLFHGENGAGTTTSGGTESILMSCKAHRDWARAVKGVSAPEMVIPSTAHAAFWKASQYFGIKLHVVPVNPRTRKADVKKMTRFINPNTIMLVGSAPNFPDGIVDPIEDLAALARKYKTGLHVDCCLGSFIISFAQRAGYSDGLPKFDFSVPGVTAISCDTHKYGFCPKGSSIIMYNSPEMRRYQYYVMTDWAGGVYASPSMAGSRPGSIIAGAWAVLNTYGVDGYTLSAKDIIGAARHFKLQLQNRFQDDLFVIGDPLLSVVAFGSDSLNIYAVGDRMSKKGWHLNPLNSPAGLHMAFTKLSAASVDQLLDDLGECIAAEKKEPESGGNLVALYGVGQTAVGPHVVGKVAEMFLDTLYEV